jgi:hypothetical protein
VQQVAAFASARVAQLVAIGPIREGGAVLLHFNLDLTSLYSLCESFENGHRWKTVSI